MTPRRSKYHATRATVDGITFDSKREAARYVELKALTKAGEISDLRCQVIYHLFTAKMPEGVPVQLPRRFQYRVDFRYMDNNTCDYVHEDVKGVRTPMYKLKKALVEASYGIEIVEI